MAHNYARIVNYRGKRPGKGERAAKIKTRGKGIAPEKGKFLRDATDEYLQECRRGVPAPLLTGHV